METQLVLSLMSTGILRVPRPYGMRMQMRKVSYEDRLEIYLTPTWADSNELPSSGQQLSVGRSLLRGIFPELSLKSRTQENRNFIRSMNIVAVWVKDLKQYKIVLPRNPETYKLYRTLDSYKKDCQQEVQE